MQMHTQIVKEWLLQYNPCKSQLGIQTSRAWLEGSHTKLASTIRAWFGGSHTENTHMPCTHASLCKVLPRETSASSSFSAHLQSTQQAWVGAGHGLLTDE